MHPFATNMYEAGMRGESIGLIAKKYKMDKSQIRRIVNRVVEERGVGAEVLHKLSDEKTNKGRDVSAVE